MFKQRQYTLDIKANSNKEFFLIHGYTGSPTDFNGLPYLLNEKFNANVKVITLVGHGTRIEDLDNVNYNDFINQIDIELRKSIKKGNKIIIGGVSLGALLSLYFASKYSFSGVINVCPTYKMRFPFNIKGLSFLGKFKKYWKKKRRKIEKDKRIGSFSYDYMHINGIKVVKESKKDLENRLKKIKCPILSIHSYNDPIGHYKSAYEINNKVMSFIKEVKILNLKSNHIPFFHNPFFSLNNKETYRKIINFVEKGKLFEENKKSKIAAIIPSFNEGERIGKVLNILNEVDLLDEIIVVDDGSVDDTSNVVNKFNGICYIKNETNLGKAKSMDIGVNSTDADIIFFCDADLIGLKKEYVEGIINPVINGDYCMFLGLRGNFMQKSIHLFAINTGERALRRVIWEQLPKYFKHNYRIEAGLNYYVNRYFGGIGYKEFNYSQPIKEKKYGFFKGAILRWKMNIDVLNIYIISIFLKFFKK